MVTAASGGTDGDAEHPGDEPAEHERRNRGTSREMGDGGSHAGGVEHLWRIPTRSDHEENRGRRGNAFFAEFQNLIASQAAGGSEGPEGDQDGDEHRHRGADEVAHWRNQNAGRQGHVGKRGQQHEDDREHRW